MSFIQRLLPLLLPLLELPLLPPLPELPLLLSLLELPLLLSLLEVPLLLLEPLSELPLFFSSSRLVC